MDNSNISGLDVNNNLDVDKILEVSRGLEGARGLGVGRGGRGLEIGPLQPFDYERASDLDNIHGYYEFPFVETPDTEGVIASGKCPFLVITSGPANYHTIPNTPSPKDYYVKIGAVNNVLPTNYTNKFQATQNGTTTVYITCKLTQQEDNLGVTQATIKDTTSDPPDFIESWPATDVRPSEVNIILGYITSAAIPDTSPTEYSYTITSGCGDVSIEEYISEATGTTFSPALRRNIYYRRIS